jgi:hypothetical protein
MKPEEMAAVLELLRAAREYYTDEENQKEVQNDR